MRATMRFRRRKSGAARATLLLAILTTVGCGAPPIAVSPSPQLSAPADPVGVIEAYVAALNRRDLAAAAALFAPGARVSISAATPLRTIETTADAIEWLESIPDCGREVTRTRESGEFIIADVVLTGGDSCPFPSGRQIEISAQVVDGRITCICLPGHDESP